MSPKMWATAENLTSNLKNPRRNVQILQIVKNDPYTSRMMYYGPQGAPGCHRGAGFSVGPSFWPGNRQNTKSGAFSGVHSRPGPVTRHIVSIPRKTWDSRLLYTRAQLPAVGCWWKTLCVRHPTPTCQVRLTVHGPVLQRCN